MLLANLGAETHKTLFTPWPWSHKTHFSGLSLVSAADTDTALAALGAGGAGAGHESPAPRVMPVMPLLLLSPDDSNFLARERSTW